MSNMLFVLGSDDNEAATRCFLFAKIAHEGGHNVNVFLTDGGVWWADRERDGSERCPTGDCPADNLPYLVEQSIPVGVCLPCARARNLEEESFHPNMRLAKGKELIHMMSDSQIYNF